MKNRTEIKCGFCNKSFKVQHCRKDITKYCSWECYTLGRRGKLRYRNGVPIRRIIESIHCELCGKEFMPSQNGRRFCSGSCRSKYTMTGRKLSPEWKKAISEGNIGKVNHNFYGRGKSGFRPDLDTFFRSSWEANVARIFNYFGIVWKYEVAESRIFLSSCSYLPDFFLPEKGIYVEVKGYDRDNKLKLLHDEKPDFPIKIIDGEVYFKLSSIFKDKISHWE